MKYLGIDYGKRKVGLSLSEGEVAAPFKVLQVNSLGDAVNKISQVLKVEEIERVIIGLPESGEARKITENFLKELKTEVDVVMVEETLSSKGALEKMIEMGSSRKARGKEDAISAAIILQNYLDSLK